MVIDEVILHFSGVFQWNVTEDEDMDMERVSAQLCWSAHPNVPTTSGLEAMTSTSPRQADLYCPRGKGNIRDEQGCDSTWLNHIASRLLRRGAPGNVRSNILPQPTRNIDSSNVYPTAAVLACWLAPYGHIPVRAGFAETWEDCFPVKSLNRLSEIDGSLPS